MTYNQLLLEIKNLPSEDKEELQDIIAKYIIEEKRENIYRNYQNSLLELKEGKLEYSKNIKTLKKRLKS
jgi:hypothetical protein